MALPTAATPGYTTYAGKVACVCLAEWLPWLQRLCRAHGYIGATSSLTVLQLTGTYVLSGGTHAGGGVYDIKQYDRRIVAIAREMGAPATWLRDMNFPDGSPGNTHTHGVLSGCPHNSQARYQLTAQYLGRDGMGYKGLKGPDPHPRPSVYRDWKQGITWAKAEIARITGQPVPGTPTTLPPSEEDELMAITVKHPITGAQVPLEDALWSMWTYILEQRDDPDETARKGWEQTVMRDGKAVNVKQELADSKTLGLANANAVADLSAKVDTLKSAVANLVTLIQESHPKADPVPEPAPLPVPATQYGVDVSGHQTLEQVKAACANPKYGFAIVKATEGLSYDSPAYAAQMAAVRASGECAGAYHFAWPNQDPLKEAEHFVRVAALKPGEMACLDVEGWPEAATTPWPTRLAYTLAWLREVKRLTGSTPLVYANWDWIKGLRTAATVAEWDELVTFPLWIAQYRTAGTFDTVSPKTGSANGWPVVMHQWTNNDGGLDGNYMPDAAAWSKYAVPNN